MICRRGLKWAILGLDLPSASHSLCNPREEAPEPPVSFNKNDE